jgi:uncharacterized protein YjbI with pentapeptide repeats
LKPPSDLPPPSVAPSKGVEDLWFEVKDSQGVRFALDADMLASIDRVEIRDQGNALLATVNAATPGVTLNLAQGRYQALLYASAASTKPVPVFVQYTVVQGGNAQAKGVSTTDKAQPQDFDLGSGNMFFGRNCRFCNLARGQFAGWNFSMLDLTGADLTGANLDGASLGKTRLTGANLTGANLTDANLTMADLVRARLTGANLTAAYLKSANLSGAIWVDGRRCLDASLGFCRL